MLCSSRRIFSNYYYRKKESFGNKIDINDKIKIKFKINGFFSLFLRHVLDRRLLLNSSINYFNSAFTTKKIVENCAP